MVQLYNLVIFQSPSLEKENWNSFCFIGWLRGLNEINFAKVLSQLLVHIKHSRCNEQNLLLCWSMNHSPSTFLGVETVYAILIFQKNSGFFPLLHSSGPKTSRCLAADISKRHLWTSDNHRCSLLYVNWSEHWWGCFLVSLHWHSGPSKILHEI